MVAVHPNCLNSFKSVSFWKKRRYGVSRLSKVDDVHLFRIIVAY